MNEFRKEFICCLTDAYEIDRASDDENDEDDDEEDMELDGAGTGGNNEAGAGNATGAPGVITADFFRQAMMMATGGTANMPTPLVTQVHYFCIFMNIVCKHHSFEHMVIYTYIYVCMCVCVTIVCVSNIHFCLYLYDMHYVYVGIIHNCMLYTSTYCSAFVVHLYWHEVVG